MEYFDCTQIEKKKEKETAPKPSPNRGQPGHERGSSQIPEGDVHEETAGSGAAAGTVERHAPVAAPEAVDRQTVDADRLARTVLVLVLDRQCQHGKVAIGHQRLQRLGPLRVEA